MTSTKQDHSRIDAFLPIHDVSAIYQIRINAPPSVVYQCLLRSDFNGLWLVRLLTTIRTGKRQARNRVPRDLPQRLQGTGFVILDDVPGAELVIGVAGKFWRPDGGRCLDLSTCDFGAFARAGYAKAAWRIKCFGRATLWKFRFYWSLVGLFSGLIRKAILKQVKTRAESILKQAS